MTYIPGSMIEEREKGGYIPSSDSPNLGQNITQVEEPKPFLSPELQELVDIATSESIGNEDKELSLEERWEYLRKGRNGKLVASDYATTDLSLSLEKRGELFKYRQSLRDLTKQEGAPWTPSTIPWPTNPLTDRSA